MSAASTPARKVIILCGPLSAKEIAHSELKGPGIRGESSLPLTSIAANLNAHGTLASFLAKEVSGHEFNTAAFGYLLATGPPVMYFCCQDTDAATVKSIVSKGGMADYVTEIRDVKV